MYERAGHAARWARWSSRGAQGLRVKRPDCDGAKCAQTDCAGHVSGAVEKVGGGDGVAAGVGEITRAQLCCGEGNEREDAATAGRS